MTTPSASPSVPPVASSTNTAPTKVVTPAAGYSSLDKRMTVDKNIVDELLLVCGVIGSTVEDDETGGLVPVTDCLNWLQDLQRALRRDDDLYRPISLLLGQWKVVQQKLLPVVLSCRYDTAMVLTVCKILVILTKPLADNTVRAGRMVINTKGHENVIKEQIKLRENALQQAETLMEYKRAICHHPSHIGPKKEGGGGILSIFVSLLAEPLSKTGTARTDADHLTIELVLHLFRNLLSAEPLLLSSTETSQAATALHCELITLLDRELVLEILLVLAANIEQRENVQYNLLLMELLNHLLRHQDPTAVARSSLSQAPTAGLDRENRPKSRAVATSAGLLKQQLQREKQSIAATATSRHSHFGGTLVVERPGGRKQYVSAALVGNKNTRDGAPVVTAKKRKNKRTEPFIGAVSTLQSHSRGEPTGGPAQIRAAQTLDDFCKRFVQDCYGPVMKSIKNEFRRDSVRLEDGDRVVFFRIAWFFCQWWRVSGKKKLTASAPTAAKDHSAQSSSLGQLIFTMDVFTFNLVLNATDTFTQHKKYARLAQTVALLSEMMHLLHVMYSSKESTEQIMAMGLMDRLFYGSEPLDRLPKLLSKWVPGTSTREYLCNLVEVCHMTLKLLEANAKACSDVSDSKDAKHDTVAKMKVAAADFDVSAYVARKIVSNHVIFMYTQLLSQYVVNAPHVNHRVVAFFLRVSKLKVATADDSANDPEMPQNLLATKTVTMEPMLFNVHLMRVLNTILNDLSIRNDKDYATTLSFASGMVRKFAVSSQNNPMLFVEALFKHPLPHRFCDLATNMYVSEELRMIAERELLLEEQQRYEQQVAAAAADEESEDEEEELEFEDCDITAPSKEKPSNLKKRARSVLEGSDEEENHSKKDAGKVAPSSKDSDDSDDEDEDETASLQKKKTAERKAELRKQVRKLEMDEESSDDDIDFGSENVEKGSEPGAKKARTIADDSDEDDE